MTENQIELPFGESFANTWAEWIQYRKEHKFKKYVPIGLKKTFTELINLSGNDEEIAIKMINRAMQNNWQGFNFKLPDYGNTKSADQLNTVYASIKQAIRDSN